MLLAPERSPTPTSEKGKRVESRWREHGRKRKRRRLSESEGEADDEWDSVPSGTGKEKTGFAWPTPSIMRITSGIHGLVSRIANVEKAVLSPQSPGKSAMIIDEDLETTKDDQEVFEALAASTPSRRRQSWLSEAAEASEEHEAMLVDQGLGSPIQLHTPELDSVAFFERTRKVVRRPQSRQHSERLPGQNTFARLHRRSPTSLVPLRERQQHLRQATRRYQLRSCVTHSTCLLGQTHLAILRGMRQSQRARRDGVAAYHQRPHSWTWLIKVGTWNGYELVRSLVQPWWLSSHEEHEVEQLLIESPVPDQDAEMVEAYLVSPVLSKVDAWTMWLQAEEKWLPTKRSGPEETPEVSERWARRNELRLREVKPHIIRLKASRESIRRALEAEVQLQNARVLRAEAARQRLLVAARQQLRIEGPPPTHTTEAAVTDEGTSSASDTSSIADTEVEAPSGPETRPASPAPSDPPEYEFPSYPTVLPRAAHLRAQAARRPALPVSPPRYPLNRYSSRSPPPPPPYNAHTDRQTVVEARFIDDSDDEEDEMSVQESLPPRLIGAFPSTSQAPIQRQAAATPVPERTSFEAALDLEEAVSDEEAVEGLAEIEQEQQGSVGLMRRWWGRVWSRP